MRRIGRAEGEMAVSESPQRTSHGYSGVRILFVISSLAEWVVCAAAAIYIDLRVNHPDDLEIFLLPFVIALFVRYVLRKEFLIDVRGLRRDIRREEII